MSIPWKKLAEYIDHTCLRPEATEAEIRKLCLEAREFGFKTVCVELKWLKLAVECLQGSTVLPITVIGFPKGTESTKEKTDQVKTALTWGAREIDMVINRDWLKKKKYEEVFQDIQAVVQEAKGIPIKVILETSELTDSEKQIASALSKAAGAQFVKTSTGFSKSGAKEADVRLMREIVGDETGVKASGGVKTLRDALSMISAGANRLGCSSSVAIVEEARKE